MLRDPRYRPRSITDAARAWFASHGVCEDFMTCNDLGLQSDVSGRCCGVEVILVEPDVSNACNSEVTGPPVADSPELIARINQVHRRARHPHSLAASAVWTCQTGVCGGLPGVWQRRVEESNRHARCRSPYSQVRITVSLPQIPIACIISTHSDREVGDPKVSSSAMHAS